MNLKPRFLPLIIFALLLAACATQNGAGADIAPTVQALQTQVADLQATASAVAVTPAATAAGSQAEGEGARNAAPSGAATPANAGEQAAASAAADDQAVPVVTNTPAPTPTPAGVLTDAYAVKITGQSGVEITFTNPRWVDEAGGFQRPNGERWLAVDVDIYNPPDNDAVTYSPLWFSLALHGESVLPVPIVGVSAGQVVVAAGDRLTGTLVFAIPTARPKQNAYTLTVQDAPLAERQPVMVTLEVGEGDD